MTKLLAIDGLPVLDAKNTLRVQITPRDIRAADPKAPGNCAIARACKRELHVIEARVHLSRIYLRTNETNWQRYVTPPGLRSEIIAFDRGGKFEPGELMLSPPAHYQQIGARAKREKRKGSHNTAVTGKKRKTPHVVQNVRTGPA